MKLYTTKEAAEILRCKPATVREYKRRGILDSLTVGGKNLLFTERAIARALRPGRLA